MITELKLKRIDANSFKAFGTYIEGPAGKPGYSDERFSWWNEAAVADLGGSVSFGFVQPLYHPDYTQTIFERHDLTPEILIPLDNDIIVVAAGREAFGGDGVQEEVGGEQESGAVSYEEAGSGVACGAFLVPAGSVVILKPGIWHYAPMTMAEKATVLVAFREKTSAEDKTMLDLADRDCCIKIVL